MADKTDQLSEEDVKQITELMDTLENSEMDYLQVELGNLKLTIGKTPLSSMVQASPAYSSSPETVPETPLRTHKSEPRQTRSDKSKEADDTVAITSPMLGIYYAQPEPGASPFVNVGDEVNSETTVALIEVMKMFTAVPAGLQGVVTEICVENEALVEFGQQLLRVRQT